MEAPPDSPQSKKIQPENIEADVRLWEWKDFPRSAIRWTLDRV
jgi:hypothetical protein